MTKQRISLKQEIPLLIWLVLVWGALWRDFSPGNLVFGVIIALLVTRVFYLPPVELSGRFNVFYFLEYAGLFLWHIAVASFQVSYLLVVQGPRIKNAVVAVPLRSHSDLMVTATGHVISLIPGSLVIEVDRSSSTLYLHTVNIKNDDDVRKIRKDVRNVEAWLIRVMGSKAELAALRAERSSGAEAKS